MNKLLRVAGIILTALGALAAWRGIFFLIPFAGFRYGMTMTLIGLLFAAAGIVMTVMTVRKEKRWKKALEDGAAQTEQAARAEQDNEAE